jgi:hypothetical protein
MRTCLQRYFFGIGLLLACTGCFTRSLVKSAVTRQYVSQKPQAVQDAYLHQGQLVINFTQQVGYSRETNWHIAVPLDTLMRLHQRKGINHTILPKETARPLKAMSLYTVLDHTPEYKDFGNGVVAELHHSIVQKFFLPRPDSIAAAKVYLLRNSPLFIYSPFNPKPLPDDNGKEDDTPPRQNMVFLYYPEKDIPGLPLTYIGFSIEFRMRAHLELLALLPLAVGADVVTAPIQILAGRVFR